MKKYYAYYDIALTYYLLENEIQAMKYVNKADNLYLDADSALSVKDILDFDIETLQIAQLNNKTLINKTIEFMNKFG